MSNSDKTTKNQNNKALDEAFMRMQSIKASINENLPKGYELSTSNKSHTNSNNSRHIPLNQYQEQNFKNESEEEKSSEEEKENSEPQEDNHLNNQSRTIKNRNRPQETQKQSPNDQHHPQPNQKHTVAPQPPPPGYMPPHPTPYNQQAYIDYQEYYDRSRLPLEKRPPSDYYPPYYPPHYPGYAAPYPPQHQYPPHYIYPPMPHGYGYMPPPPGIQGHYPPPQAPEYSQHYGYYHQHSMSPYPHQHFYQYPPPPGYLETGGPGEHMQVQDPYYYHNGYYHSAHMKQQYYKQHTYSGHEVLNPHGMNSESGYEFPQAKVDVGGEQNSEVRRKVKAGKVQKEYSYGNEDREGKEIEG